MGELMNFVLWLNNVVTVRGREVSWIYVIFEEQKHNFFKST